VIGGTGTELHAQTHTDTKTHKQTRTPT